MSIWGRVFAAGYDRFMAGAERATFVAHRRALIARASGDVLEIGGGTGANLPFYGDAVSTLTITEPEAPMLKRLRRHVAEQGVSATVVQAPAESLPFADASFDTVVTTLVLCTVGDQPRALAELRRVLRPGGALLFMEHVRSDDPKLARWQDRFNPVQLRIGHGCNCNRDTLAGISRAGFSVGAVERDAIHKAPPVVRPLIVGAADA